MDRFGLLAEKLQLSSLQFTLDSSTHVDVQAIEELAALAARCNLEEIEVECNGSRVRVRRNCGGRVAEGDRSVPSSGDVAVAADARGECAKKERDLPCIFSPMIGTFYRASAPGRPALVEIGSVLNAQTVVCIIEAMKVMNEIPAEIEGTVIEVLVKDGQAVEFGQPLFKISPKG
ncbi:MAG: acetyl-CoA carboxylase biotin carboxyl carrier protein [Puniceicoccales bacterium]|jgi:acetyl-CoA carboxylase biotin carboxyl carrier protein|nr:acetyl-CoA carboxylase biotin carboxyl carrier protein [Puniceicoccales bacterium]